MGRIDTHIHCGPEKKKGYHYGYERVDYHGVPFEDLVDCLSDLAHSGVFNAMALTEHNEIDRRRSIALRNAVNERLNGRKVEACLGAELTLRHKDFVFHVVALFRGKMEDRAKIRLPRRNAPLMPSVKRLKKNDAKVVLAHPYLGVVNSSGVVRQGSLKDVVDDLIWSGVFDGVEVVGGSFLDRDRNVTMSRLACEVLEAMPRRRPAIFGASDAHNKNSLCGSMTTYEGDSLEHFFRAVGRRDTKVCSLSDPHHSLDLEQLHERVLREAERRGL